MSCLEIEIYEGPKEAELQCPLSQDLLEYPVRDRNRPQHVYSKYWILKYLNGQEKASPLDRSHFLKPLDLVPAKDVQILLDEYLRFNSRFHRQSKFEEKKEVIVLEYSDESM